MDVQLRETFDGGDFVMKRGNVSVIEGFENMPYLAMFGGNPGFVTPVSRQANQQAFDFWGNNVFAENNLTLQFNSYTEEALMIYPLTSNGRLQIEQSVKKDLQFMREFVKIGISVVIIGVDRIVIGIRMIQPENLAQKDFIYIWDATKLELILKDGEETTGLLSGGSTPPVDSGIFDQFFDFSFE